MSGTRRVAIVALDVPGGMGPSVRRGFEEAGCETTLVPYPNWLPVLRRRFRGVGQVNRVLSGLTRPRAEARLLRTLRAWEPDLVVIIKCDDLHARTYRALQGLEAPVVAFHPDDPFNQGSGLRTGPSHPRALDQLRGVDLYLIWSDALVTRCGEAGARRVAYLPFACDPTLHPRVEALDAPTRAALAADVTFIGNWDEERERWLTPVAEAGLDLAIWGNDYWRSRCRNPAVRAAWRGRPLVGSEQGQAIAASLVNLNILRRQNKNATNMRTFELPCQGGFMLHERSEALTRYFPVGESCLDFGDPDELVTQIRRCLEVPTRCREMAEAAHLRALGLTYRWWAEQVLRLVDASPA